MYVQRITRQKMDKNYHNLLIHCRQSWTCQDWATMHLKSHRQGNIHIHVPTTAHLTGIHMNNSVLEIYVWTTTIRILEITQTKQYYCPSWRNTYDTYANMLTFEQQCTRNHTDKAILLSILQEYVHVHVCRHAKAGIPSLLLQLTMCTQLVCSRKSDTIKMDNPTNLVQ